MGWTAQGANTCWQTCVLSVEVTQVEQSHSTHGCVQKLNEIQDGLDWSAENSTICRTWILELEAGLVGIAVGHPSWGLPPTMLLVCIKAGLLADWVGLGCSTCQFVWKMGLQKCPGIVFTSICIG